MLTSLDSAPVADEQVSFTQYYLPGLDAGRYQLTVTQSVTNSSNTPLYDYTQLTNSYTFAVLGDRFSISQPASTVYATFPADNATGEFGTVLPHVVFVKKTFPWSRSPCNPPVSSPVDTAGNVPTWLAVLALDADDKVPAPTQRTVADLLPDNVPGGQLPATITSYFAGATDTSGLVGQQLTDKVLTLDVPLPLFWQLAPSFDDLGYMAHARQVSLVSKPTLPRVSDVGESVVDFSIVVGNRVPQDGQKTTAYLVSLEGLQQVLPGPNGIPPASWPAGISTIRLAVLQSWSFFSTGAQAAFTDTLQALNGRVYDSQNGGYTPPQAAITTLALPYTGTNTLVQNALAMGYAPLNHTLRNGGSSVSWYRGPLAPYPVPAGQVAVPLASADQATRFDPTTGMLDTSYAAAWTLGRWLALQDKHFSTALYQWKNGLQQTVLQAIENELLSEPLLPPGSVPPAAADAVDAAAPVTEGPAAPSFPRTLGHRLQHQLLTAFTSQ